MKAGIDLAGALKQWEGLSEAMDGIVKAAAIKGASDVVEQAYNRAVEMAPVESGRLRDSIGKKVYQNGTAILYFDLDKTRVDGKVPYALPITFGYNDRGGNEVAPNPFLFVAANEAASKLKDKVEKEIEKNKGDF